MEWDAGIGISVHGFQPAAGVYAGTLAGTLEGMVGYLPADFDIEGTNVGAFLELKYGGDEISLLARIRGMAGDVEGWVF